MLKEYLYNNTYKYTLTSGSEVTLTDDELNELIENSELVEDLKEQIEDLKDQIEELESDVRCLQEDVDDNKEEIDSLNEEIAKLEKQIWLHSVNY